MENNNSIFVQAKIEYTKQLVNTLKPPIYDGIKSIYEDAKQIYKSNSSTSLLYIFRTLLEKIPEWNNELILNETDRIIECSKCDWLDELVTAVYISHTKILMSIGNSNSNKINLTIPKLINFIHKCYINIAREIWKNPLLFSEDISGYEYQKNMNIIENIISECIENTIRISLPVKDILKEHLDINENKTTNSSNESKLLNELKELLLNSNKKDIEELVEGNTNKENDNKEEEDLNISQEEESPVENDKKIIDNEPNNEPNNESNNKPNNKPNNVFINETDYESPDEETINKKVENIEINDIPDVTEPVYDNPDIIENSEKDNDELYKKLIKINDDNKLETFNDDESIKVSKVEQENTEQIINIPEKSIEEPVLSTEDTLKKEEEDTIKFDKIQDITKEEEEINKVEDLQDQIIIDPNKSSDDYLYIENEIDKKDSEFKELLTVDKKDDDAETIDLFYQDLKDLNDKKGLTMESVDEDKYVLFDDL
jgi:hypothetical protein